MNDFVLNLLALLTALAGQAAACGLGTALFLSKSASIVTRRTALALAGGAGLLALQHGYALELALRTGLYDLRQALLAAGAAVLIGLAVGGLRRQA